MTIINRAILLSFWMVLHSSKGNAGEIFDQQHGGTFHYFAYGSNLLKTRMHINCPSAKFIAKAKLEGWRLDFNMSLPMWQGAVSNIVEDRETRDYYSGYNETTRAGGVSVVWGAIWQINNEEMTKLDAQEGVHLSWYVPKYLWVNASFGHTGVFSPIQARTYVQYFEAPPYVKPEELPYDRQPSRTYFQAILFGAIESRLPVSYLDYLQRFPNNGLKASYEKLEKLGYPFWEPEDRNRYDNFNLNRANLPKAFKAPEPVVTYEVPQPQLDLPPESPPEQHELHANPNSTDQLSFLL